MRLTAIRNERKQTISSNSGHGLLQMVLEPNTGWCASKDAGPPREVDCEISHRLERGAKHLRVWKPLPNRRVLKS